jgi:hypothetical protein
VTVADLREVECSLRALHVLAEAGHALQESTTVDAVVIVVVSNKFRQVSASESVDLSYRVALACARLDSRDVYSPETSRDCREYPPGRTCICEHTATAARIASRRGGENLRVTVLVQTSKHVEVEYLKSVADD